MTFQNPAGLWLLLGVPFLIILFIIRSKHRDRNVSSTFIWRLSSRFMKKRIRFSALSRILLLIIGILAVVLAAALASRPMIEHLPGEDYILVFDCSASMQVRGENGQSRFDRAVAQAKALADEIENGHRVSVISAGDEAVTLLGFCTDKNEAVLSLNALSCEYGGCDLDGAFRCVNELSGQTKNPKVIVYTDRTVEKQLPDHVEIVNLAGENGEVNLTVTSLSSRQTARGFEFIGTVFSDGYTGNAVAALEIDGKTIDASLIECTAGAETQVKFAFSSYVNYTRARLYLRDTEEQTKDGFALDDSFVLTKKYTRKRSVEVLSAHPYFYQKLLEQYAPDCTLDVVYRYEDFKNSGYDLYIIDHSEETGDVSDMEGLPQDGSVILFGLDAEALGVRLGEERTTEAVIVRTDAADLPLILDFNDTETVLGYYRVLDVSSAWKTLLTCGDEPVAAVKMLPSGKAITAFSFVIYDSNLPLQSKFIRLIDDLLTFSAPPFIAKGEYTVGAPVDLYAEDGGDLFVSTPDGSPRALDKIANAAAFTPYETGVYTAVESGAEEELRKAEFFVHVPYDECRREPIPETAEVIASSNDDAVREAKLDIALWLAIALLILLLLEWGVFIYEQY